MAKQKSFDKVFLDLAVNIGNQLSYSKRSKVGAVIVKNNRPISIGYNGTPDNHENKCEDENGKTLPSVIHAEENAICYVARTTESTEGSTLYTSMAPCESCARMVIQAGIVRVVYLNRYRFDGGISLLNKSGITVERIHPQFKPGED
jgi:dCMP deaminase